MEIYFVAIAGTGLLYGINPFQESSNAIDHLQFRHSFAAKLFETRKVSFRKEKDYRCLGIYLYALTFPIFIDEDKNETKLCAVKSWSSLRWNRSVQ